MKIKSSRGLVEKVAGNVERVVGSNLANVVGGVGKTIQS